MVSFLIAGLRTIGPAMAHAKLSEQLRAGAGAAIGILLCAALVLVFPGTGLYLVAPLGATAVLVFAVPNSPLAQPWSAVVGNSVAAVAAVAVVTTVPSPWAPALAVGIAIAAMMMLRALHPPGGAVALLAALDAEAVREAGVLFAVAPVGLLTALLVAAATAYNRATGRTYPFRRRDEAPQSDLRLGLTTQELQNLLEKYNQSANVGAADLGRLLAAAEREAAHHRFGATTCADVVGRRPITVRLETPAIRMARLFRRHNIKSLPVVDGDQRLLGIVLQSDLLEYLTPRLVSTAGGGLRRTGRAAGHARAGRIMRTAPPTVPADTPVGVLLNVMSHLSNQVVAVVQDDRLVGVITRSDLIALLLRDGARRSAAA